MWGKGSLYRGNKTTLMIMVNILIIVFALANCSLTGTSQENILIKDYLGDQFDSVIFYLYLNSMGELDSQEREFIDLLADQSEDRQLFYGKKVYQEGFNSELLGQLKKEIEEREKEAIEVLEEIVYEVPELIVPALPRMKLGERIYARMVSMQKMITMTDYNRFLICGVELARSERVVKRVRNYFDWCKQWTKEGREVEALAEKAKAEGNVFLARRLFHEAAGCYHIGGFINYYDIEEKIEAQNLARQCYEKVISLYEEQDRPIRIEIPFRDVEIPGYLLLTNQPGQPLLIFVNVLNNIKEVENHFFAQDFLRAGFNVFGFDGPGQGEMHQKMRLIPDYEEAIFAIIDWFEMNNDFNIDTDRIGVMGMSFGGLSSIIAAALDPRIDCVISNGGFAYFPPLSQLKKLSIPTKRAVYYMTGYHKMSEVAEHFGHLDIKECPPLDRPMMIVQGGRDKTVPVEHAYYFMDWAIGDKELLYYEDANHCCQDRFDLITPYTIDWLKKYL